MESSNELDNSQRREILDALSARVERFFQRSGQSPDQWRVELQEFRPLILGSDTREEFEGNITLLLRSLKISHVGFYREDLERCSAKMALCATYAESVTHGEKRWVFQDVHRGGPADLGGIQPGDVLLGVGSTKSIPPEHPVFKMGSEVRLTIEGRHGQVFAKTVAIPRPKRRNQLPFAEPAKVAYGRKVNSEVGCLTVSMFPGAIGIDVANEIESELHYLRSPRRLIVDLRGNGGGGLGFLRLLNLLDPDATPVGTFQQYRTPANGLSKVATYFAVDHVPRNRVELARLALRYSLQAVKSRLRKQALSVQLRTRSTGAHPYHGRTVILINRHTASASEMIVAHARDRRLALLVGEPTTGRIIGGGKTRLPHAYWVVLPTGTYWTAAGEFLEGAPIQPDVIVPFDPTYAREGEDGQMEKALEIVHSL